MGSPNLESSDVMVVIDKKYEGHISDVVEKLKGLGMTIDNVDEADGVIEGTVDSSKLAQIRTMDGVDYLRNVMTYIEHDPESPPVRRRPLES